MADPNLAFILLVLAVGAGLIEVATRGVGIGAVVAGVLVLVALYPLVVLPTSAVGVALLVVAATLLAIEVMAPVVGVAGLVGTAVLVLSGRFLFDRASGVVVDWVVIVPVAALAGGLAIGLTLLVRRVHRRRPATGDDALVGRRALVSQADDDEGQVLLDGIRWSARSVDGGLERGGYVTVLDRDGLELIVTRDDADPMDGRSER